MRNLIENGDSIKNILFLICSLYVPVFIHHIVENHIATTHRYDKLLGLSDTRIILRIIKSEVHQLLIVIVVMACLHQWDSIKIVQYLFTIMFILAFLIVFLYMARSKSSLYRFVCRIYAAFIILISLQILNQFIKHIYSGKSLVQSIVFSFQTDYRNRYDQYSLYCGIIAIIMISLMLYTLKYRQLQFDYNAQKRILRIRLLDDFYEKIQVRYKTSDILSYFVFLIVFGYLLMKIRSSESIVLILSILMIGIVSVGTEMVYLSDCDFKMLYAICGESFFDFFFKKLIHSVCLQAPFCISVILICFYQKYTVSVAVILLFTLFSVVFWNVWYSYLFFYFGILPRSMIILLNLSMFFLQFTVLFPVIGAPVFFIKAQQSWRNYVGD